MSGKFVSCNKLIESSFNGMGHDEKVRHLSEYRNARNKSNAVDMGISKLFVYSIWTLTCEL